MAQHEEEIEMAVKSGNERSFRYDGTYGHFTAKIEGNLLRVDEDFGDTIKLPLSFVKLITRMLDG